MYVGFTRAQHNHIKNILKDTSLVYTKDKHELFPQKPTHSLLFFILFEATCFGFMIISHPSPKFVWSSFFHSFQGFSLFWIPTMLHTRTNLSTSKPIPICTHSPASQSVAVFVFIYVGSISVNITQLYSQGSDHFYTFLRLIAARYFPLIDNNYCCLFPSCCYFSTSTDVGSCYCYCKPSLAISI